jgi:cellobiose epimerase
MKSFQIFVLLILIICCQTKAQNSYLGIPVYEIEKATVNHLNRWYPTIIDSVNGGYYTNFEYNWERSNDQLKMLVTQARGLWTAARAATVFSKNEIYKKASNHGYMFLTTKMWDHENGGFELYYSPENLKNKTPYKLIYGNSFALLALAEYAKINPSKEVLGWVEKTFDWIDSVAHDNLNSGYYNLVLNEELKANTPKNQAYIADLDWGEPKWKDQNTSIHLLEAFTTTYQVLPISKVKKRLKEMLELVSKTMPQPSGTLKLYFTNDWRPIDYSGLSRSFILENQDIDHISFGHNIETAYLIIDASVALNGKVDSTSLSIAKKLTDHTLKYGFATNNYGLYDRGYQFEKGGKIEIISRNKAWWSQFEAWHTLALMSRYFPEEEQYQVAFQQMWKYIQNELFDHKYGGCYNYGLDESTWNKKDRKAHMWKCPYHDGRALMNVWEYARKENLEKR